MVGIGLYVRRYERLGETWPTRSRIELVGGAEQRLAGDNVDVDAGLVVIPVFVVERRFCRCLLRNIELLAGQLATQLRVGWLLVVDHVLYGVLLSLYSGRGRHRDCETQRDPEYVPVEREHRARPEVGLIGHIRTSYLSEICTSGRAKWFYCRPDLPGPARIFSNNVRARGSFDCPSQKSAFFRTDGSRLVWAT